MPANPKLFTLCYFAPISWYTCALTEGANYIESCDTYQKQSFRNRCVIYSPNGAMPLVIPIIHNREVKQTYREIKIDDRQKWRQVHRKSIETAYRKSPFFPYFEDELNDLYASPTDSLFEFNLQCQSWIERLIQKRFEWNYTEDWDADFEGVDLRERIHPKKESILSAPGEYHQTFEHKLGFLPDLSILDVVFNKGMETLSYLSNNQSKLKI